MNQPRLQVVVGKGGVGRTTTSIGLALAAGRADLRTLVVELNGLWDIGRRFGLKRSFTRKQIAPNVWWRSMTSGECLEDFGRRKLKLGIVGASVMGSRPLAAFVDAVPGLSDLMQLGKIDNLLNEPLDGDPVYDRVIIDAPATGHGLTLLSAPRSMTDISGAGPFHELARVIADQLSSEDTGIVVTTLPEVLPLSETLTLLDDLAAIDTPTQRIVVNRVTPAPVPDLARWPEVKAALTSDGDADIARLAELAEQLLTIHEDESAVLHTLASRAAALGVPIVRIPRLAELKTRRDHDAVALALEVG
jgi:anion-transporting  ArsA/GET3 family ATPase